MLRASIAAELAGVPTASLICEGFVGQAATTSAGLGLPELPVAAVPGHVDTQPLTELDANVTEVTVPQVIASITAALDNGAGTAADPEPDARETVLVGSFEEVNEHFLEHRWSDGLPIVPPTIPKIEEFLRHTHLDPDHVLGVAPPDNRAATVWSVAANGVMAGCRPEYMPLLVALAEALTDPGYGVEHSGNTPGSETLITLNGPIIARLGFNYEQGVLRDGFQPNTTVGRFWRLLLRNVAGFLPHETDKGTFGGTWRVVMAENESVLERIGWSPLSASFGFGAGEDVVTVSRYTSGGVLASVFGHEARQLVGPLADGLRRHTGWELVFSVGLAPDTYRPLLLLSPVLAETVANDGWSKADLTLALWEEARMTAAEVERYVGEWSNLVPGRRSLQDMVAMRKASPVYGGRDPDRRVPITSSPDDLLVAVTGDPLRTNAYVFAHNGMLGYPTAKAIAPDPRG